MRVVLAGDSHLTETSPHRPVTKLAPRLRSLGLDVVSVAAGGANSRDVLRQEIPAQADWVLYSIGTNDAAPWKRVPSDEFAVNCDQLFSAPGPGHRIALGPGPVVERAVRGERTNTDMTNYALVLEQAAARHAVRYVSLAGLLVDSDLAEDGVHLNDSGYEKLTERVLNELGVQRTGLPVDEEHRMSARGRSRRAPIRYSACHDGDSSPRKNGAHA
jgi:lysophospholipase L1-like esterase